MISVVIPTRDRAQTLARTLAALRGQVAPEGGFEVVVVDNGSRDETSRVVEAAVPSFRHGLRLLSEPKRGPAAARNRGMRSAAGEVVLFMGDDMIPADSRLVAGHASLHARRPEPTFAVLGRATWHPDEPVTEFMRWLEESGVQFDFGTLSPGPVSSVTHFYTANLSVKKQLVLDVGGFDERFSGAALEDVELGIRLTAAGVELVYDPSLLVLHVHSMTVAQSLDRMVRVGRAGCLYNRLYAGNAGFWRPPVPARKPWVQLTRVAARLLAGERLPLRVRKRAWRDLHAAAYDRGYLLGPPAG